MLPKEAQSFILVRLERERENQKETERRKTKKKKKKTTMGYVLRVRLASFFTGAAAASFFGLYTLHKDYKIAHESISQQMKNLHDSLDGRISSLENLKHVEASQHAEATE